MIRYCLCIVVFVLVAAPLAADEQLKTAVMKSATEMRDAILKNDFAKVLDSTYAGVVKEAGGRDKAIAMAEQAMQQIKTQGIAIVGCELGEPGEFYPEGNKLFVILPTKNELTFPKGKILSKSYLLGISSDSGKTWTFVEGAGMKNKEAMDKMLPKLPEKLVLPLKEKPEIIPNK